MIREQVKHAVGAYMGELDEAMLCNVYRMVLDEVEKALLEVVMERADNNQTTAARILGINRNTLRRKLEKYDLP
ncbi:MAG: Fis family transcriptional regulator [Gammaproteobacteria bacterium]|nr:Fis family transcriptional regulator [Gammaproteobacteria bacterium]MYJ52572.1 Fis family transcriptional regulator [Gammaproteobacteria bacterium]